MNWSTAPILARLIADGSYNYLLYRPHRPVQNAFIICINKTVGGFFARVCRKIRLSPLLAGPAIVFLEVLIAHPLEFILRDHTE